MDRIQTKGGSTRGVLEYPDSVGVVAVGLWGRLSRVAARVSGRVASWGVHVLIACAGIGTLAYVWDSAVAYIPPVEWTASTIYPRVVRPGGIVVIGRTFTVQRTEVVEIVRTMVQTNCTDRCVVYSLEESRFTTQPGTYIDRKRTHLIPDHVLPGEYSLNFDVRWQNALGKTYSAGLPPLSLTVVR